MQKRFDRLHVNGLWTLIRSTQIAGAGLRYNWLLVLLMIMSLDRMLAGPSAPEGASSGNVKPALRILYTSDTEGYIEPCGCSGNEAGGLAQRATLLRQLREGAEQTIVIDGGDFADSDPDRARMIDKACWMMGYDIGTAGWKTVTSEQQREKEARLDQWYLRRRPFRIRVVRRTSTAVSDETLEEALKRRGRKPDLAVLIDRTNLESNKRLAKRLGGVVDVIFGGKENIQLSKAFSETSAALRVRSVVIPQTSSRGRHVIVMDFERWAFREDGWNGLRLRSVSLMPVKSSLAEDPRIHQLVAEYHAAALKRAASGWSGAQDMTPQ